MKAMQLDDGALRVGEVPVPEPARDEARVRISASGVCHSDLHLARGEWMGVPPMGTLGHEAIGVIDALGPGAEQYVDVGDRVILGLGGMGGGYWCGACDYCLSGRPRLCAQAKPLMGTFAEQMCVWAPRSCGSRMRSETRRPRSRAVASRPSARCASSPRHGVMPGRTIGVIGAAGGLGHYGVQIANAFGYRVVGVDVGEERLEFVRSLGAAHVVSADDAAALAMTLGGLDAVLVFAARLAGFELGLQLLRARRPVRRGRHPAVE